MTPAASSGVVTFLFTDVEGSTRRWETDAQRCGGRWPPMMRCCTARLRRTAANCRATSAFAQQSPLRNEYPKSLRRAAQIGQELRLTLETPLLDNVIHTLIGD